MMTTEAIPELPDDSLSKELLAAKFKTFAKEHFQTFARKENDYLQYIKKSAQLTSLRMPEEMSELFIRFDMAQYFWICDTVPLLKYEEWLKIDSRGKQSQMEGYRSVKDFYAKWAIVKAEQEKKYYALSLIRVIERDNNRNNFLKYILQAVILIFDRQLSAPDKALQLLQETLELMGSVKLDESLRDELVYLINVYMGFAYMKTREWQDANNCFSVALRLKPSGITAKFYLAYTDKKLGRIEAASLLLHELMEYDKAILELAVDQNRLIVMTYTIYNALIYEIFNEPEFAELLEEIDRVMNNLLQDDGFTFEQTGALLLKLEDLHLSEFYTEEINKGLEFMDKACHTFIGNNNSLMLITRPFMRAKFLKTIELILASISQRYGNEISADLEVFEIGIKDNMEAIRHLTKEQEEVKVTYKKKIEDALKDLEERVSIAVAAIEKKIENIHLQKEYNPQTTFNNSMVYNAIITLLVFIIAGFSGCYRDSVNNVYDFKDVISIVTIAGGKWAAITFLIGIILSGFSAIFAFTERMAEKQNLLRKVTYYKNHQERESELLKRDLEKKERSVIENYKERIEEHKKLAENLKIEKEGRYIALKDMMDKKVKAYADKIETIFKTEG